MDCYKTVRDTNYTITRYFSHLGDSADFLDKWYYDADFPMVSTKKMEDVPGAFACTTELEYFYSLSINDYTGSVCAYLPGYHTILSNYEKILKEEGRYEEVIVKYHLPCKDYFATTTDLNVFSTIKAQELFSELFDPDFLPVSEEELEKMVEDAESTWKLMEGYTTTQKPEKAKFSFMNVFRKR